MVNFGLDYKKLNVRAFMLPGPSTYRARVRCPSVSPYRRPWLEVNKTLFLNLT